MPSDSFRAAPGDPDISIVIPVFNEAESVEELYGEIDSAMRAEGSSYETIFVDDGSSDGTGSVLARLRERSRAPIDILAFPENRGKTEALSRGFAQTRGSIILMLDGDGQDDPREIPRFIDAIRGGADLACGWKRERRDPLARRAASKIFNAITSLASGVRLHDHNCGFKAYRREVALSLPLTGDLHRYIPFLARALGFTRIVEVPVHHRARKYGHSKYGAMRFIHGAIGLAHALWVARQLAHAAQRAGSVSATEPQRG
jgi:glycosyltransferase involved in cell wall biosynthesis